mmetsp:Transcript_9805/g.36424  ORF Transcript_9805/g.36424 Transcript_9805/m.36424 type:complete len:212 (+) Transcript_9805:3083-3718(+)
MASNPPPPPSRSTNEAFPSKPQRRPGTYRARRWRRRREPRGKAHHVHPRVFRVPPRTRPPGGSHAAPRRRCLLGDSYDACLPRHRKSRFQSRFRPPTTTARPAIEDTAPRRWRPPRCVSPPRRTAPARARRSLGTCPPPTSTATGEESPCVTLRRWGRRPSSWRARAAFRVSRRRPNRHRLRPAPRPPPVTRTHRRPHPRGREEPCRLHAG